MEFLLDFVVFCLSYIVTDFSRFLKWLIGIRMKHKIYIWLMSKTFIMCSSAGLTCPKLIKYKTNIIKSLSTFTVFDTVWKSATMTVFSVLHSNTDQHTFFTIFSSFWHWTNNQHRRIRNKLPSKKGTREQNFGPEEANQMQIYSFKTTPCPCTTYQKASVLGVTDYSEGSAIILLKGANRALREKSLNSDRGNVELIEFQYSWRMLNRFFGEF